MSEMVFEVEAFGMKHKLVLETDRYSNNRVCINAVDYASGEQFGRMTVNLPDEEIGENEVFIKTWSENKVWIRQALAALPNVFKNTGRKARAGYTEAEVWEFTPEIST